MQLWGTASTSNIGILERFAHDSGSNVYVPNTAIPWDLQTPAVKEALSTALASAHTQTA
jgi:hypothetical protein